MKIRKGFGAPCGRHTCSVIQLQDASARAMVDDRPDKGDALDPHRSKCTAMGLNSTTAANGSGNTTSLEMLQQHCKECQVMVNSNGKQLGRCIMCGEAGHSCIQLLAQSHAAARHHNKYTCSNIPVVLVPMLQILQDDDVQSCSDILHVHPASPMPRYSRRKKVRYGTLDEKRPASTHYDLIRSEANHGCVNGNKFELKAINHVSVARKRTHTRKAKGNFKQRSTSASNKQLIAEVENAASGTIISQTEVIACKMETSADQKPSVAHDARYRCKRMDGKGWQCRRKAEAGFSLCEYHLSKFRANHIRNKAAKVRKEQIPSKTELSAGRKKSQQILQSKNHR